MPKAHHRMLNEIARRRSFRDNYVAQANNARATLTKMMEEENSCRARFMEKYGKHLPADLIGGLLGSAPPAAVDMPDFDGDLPCIEFDSLRQQTEASGGGSASVMPTAGGSVNSTSGLGSANADAHGSAVGD